MTDPPPVLDIEGLHVAVRRRDVLHIDRFQLQPGEVVAVLGPNGSGKSTLLRAAAFLVPDARGTLRLFGQHPRGRRHLVRLRRRTASVFSDPTLLDVTAVQNVELGLRLRGVPSAERRERARDWLERLGVTALAHARPHTLSAGEAQRVALARAFAVQPELLLLDEPFAAVDVETRARLIGELRELLAAHRTAALLATHDRTEAELLADRICVLLEGRVQQDEPAARVIIAPRTPEVASFLGYSCVPAAALAAAFPALPPEGATACLAPGALRVVPAGTPHAVRLPVVRVQGALGHVRAVCALAAAATVEVELPPSARHLEALDVCLDASRVRWFSG